MLQLRSSARLFCLPRSVPFAVGLYIAGAYWFTASTSFANPAVTIARALTDTFAGIRPADAGGFIGAHLFRWLLPSLPSGAGEAVVPYEAETEVARGR